jgi:uncharacterized lipoprotein YddW (UPF0748 family)
MLKYLLLIAAIALSMPAMADIDYTKASPPVELRAIWVDAGAIPKSEAGIESLVRLYKKANINLLLPEVIARGYTIYPSKLIARDPRFAGAIDPLPILIREAHAAGMEVHPWVWVFRAGYTQDRGAILKAHPDWVELSKYGEDLSASGGFWVSPSIPAARDFLSDLYRELVTNYDVDGIHLDYIRYEVQSPSPYGYCRYARDAFKKSCGIDPMDVDRLTSDQYSWNLYRERQINTFIQRVSIELRTVKPKLVISAAVGSDIKSARLTLMQNWANWVENKWVDFLTTMTYTDVDTSFANQVAGQKQTLGDRVILAPGIGLHMMTKNPEQMVSQIGIARGQSCLGQALFASSYFGDPQQMILTGGPYSNPAELPFRDPQAKADALTQAADKLKAGGDIDQSRYCSNLASVLAEYTRFRQTPSPYVPPTTPPFDIPPSVVPLPCVQVTKASAAITVDGKLDDAAWAGAAKAQLSYTNLGDPAPVVTTALLTYDDSCLYIGFDAAEPRMSRVKATVDKRDGPTFYDDSVEVYVDPTAKRRDYYHLSTNTLGTRFDQKALDPGWNAEWSTASVKGTSGWTTEMAIPFASLGASTPTPGAQWALNLTRNRWATGLPQYLTWAVPYGGFHSPDRFGTITFE